MSEDLSSIKGTRPRDISEEEKQAAEIPSQVFSSDLATGADFVISPLHSLTEKNNGMPFKKASLINVI